jgi:hypothetical protein
LKVKITDNGVETLVDAGSIKVNDVYLTDWLKRFVKLETEVRKLTEAYTTREKTLKEAIKKL